MGAKTAVKLRNRGAAYKCDLCGRKLMTPDALVVHQRTAHNIITRRTKPKQIIKPMKSSKVEVKAKPVKKTLTPLKNTPKISDKKAKAEDKKETIIDEEPDLPESKPEKKKKTVEFGCPKCFREFLTYFPALKHIQKYHCVNRQGTKVPPNSPSLIQPVRIELCLKCKRKVKSIQTHICDDTVKEKTEGQVFICKACEEWFPNLKSFDTHVLCLHGNEVESMFFPTNVEFTKWKTEMESQTNASYAILDKYDSKKYYHCNSINETNEKTNSTYFCPSTIVIQEFSKGIQVHFYKEHFNHSFVDYTLSDKYKKYSITSFLKRSEEYNTLPKLKNDDHDMYLQFKNLMEGIVVDAAKINVTTLKILVGKALDMTSILTNYDEEVDDSNTIDARNVSQTMNDSQITKALEENNLNTGKRKNNNKIESVSEIKKTKFDIINQDIDNDTSSPKILNSFSLANDVDAINKLNNEDSKTEKIDKTKTNDGEQKPMKRLKDVNQSPSSFNDSYKDFVVKNFPSKESEVRTRNRPGRPVVKTKIGQFKPSLSPKSPVKVEAKKIESDKVSRLSLDKPKVDFEYEVKEQEEGCNILILKI